MSLSGHWLLSAYDSNERSVAGHRRWLIRVPQMVWGNLFAAKTLLIDTHLSCGWKAFKLKWSRSGSFRIGRRHVATLTSPMVIHHCLLDAVWILFECCSNAVRIVISYFEHVPPVCKWLFAHFSLFDTLKFLTLKACWCGHHRWSPDRNPPE